MNFVNSYVMGDNDVKFYLEKEREQHMGSTRKIFGILKTSVPCSSKDFQSKRPHFLLLLSTIPRRGAP